MSPIKYLIIGACAVAATAATAQNLHVNDAAYVGIARCQGLINSDDLQPRVDPTGINRFMDLEGAGRQGTIIDQARDNRDKAAHDAAVAGPDEKAHLLAERDGPCRRWRRMGNHAPGAALTGE